MTREETTLCRKTYRKLGTHFRNTFPRMIARLIDVDFYYDGHKSMFRPVVTFKDVITKMTTKYHIALYPFNYDSKVNFLQGDYASQTLFRQYLKQKPEKHEG